jgi:hypothetical protein
MVHGQSAGLQVSLRLLVSLALLHKMGTIASTLSQEVRFQTCRILKLVGGGGGAGSGTANAFAFWAYMLGRHPGTNAWVFSSVNMLYQ